tara:strand:+ start:2014 stop:3060 length:1047 start_codon:yes stop_codon:yes gene_type:complete
MPAKRGRSGKNIGSHGTAIAVDDVSSSLNESGDRSFTFKPDPSDIVKASNGAKIFKFPLDDVSAGNFWTRLIINTWVPTTRPQGGVAGQGGGLDKDSIANIWLPMPLALETAYNQNYSDAEHMTATSGVDATTGEGTLQIGSNILTGVMSEIQSGVSKVMNANSSGAMSKGSIINNQMGLVYDGATLRSHTLAWRMIPKDREEQRAIETICLAFKRFSSPVLKGVAGGELNVTSSSKAQQAAVNDVEKAGADTSEPSNMLDEIEDALSSIGRLGIPVTVGVEFWFGAHRNKHLFQIKDSFIQSVTVNYTPTGVWNAYEDGAPIETQLTVALKENSIVTANDLMEVGGF